MRRPSGTPHSGSKTPGKAFGRVKSDKTEKHAGTADMRIKRLFQDLDQDGSGGLDEDELFGFLKHLCPDVEDFEIHSMFDKIDKNHNGKVDFNEFIDYLFESGHNHDAHNTEELEVQIPKGGAGLVLGGRSGNVVIKTGYVPKIQKGWRVVAMNGHKMEPAALVEAMQGQKSTHFSLTFEVDKKYKAASARSTTGIDAFIADRRTAARKELEALLGCTKIEDLDKKTDEERAAIMSNPRLPKLLAESHSVFETEVLLNECSGAQEAMHIKLINAVTEAGGDVMEKLTDLKEFDCFKRDGDGNVLLHFVKDKKVAEKLLSVAPGARLVQNIDGRTPLNDLLAKDPKALDTGMLELLLGGEPATMRQILFANDEEGVCAAMRLHEDDADALKYMLPDWERLEEALTVDTGELLKALEAVGSKEWPGLLAYHCFEDVVREGTHTARSWERLGTVWETMGRTIRQCITKDVTAMAPAHALMDATKGPHRPPVDMRMPYRESLNALMDELQHECGDIITKGYEGLSGEAADWMKHNLQTKLNPDLMPDISGELGLQCKNTMVFKFKDGAAASEQLTPEWSTAEEPALEQVYQDLTKVGMISNVRKSDAAYDMLRLAGMDRMQHFTENEGSLWLCRCYAAYLRGSCQQQQDAILKSVLKASGNNLVVGTTLIGRQEAKSFPRLMEKSLQRIEEIHDEMKEAGIKLGEEAKIQLRRVATSICDINGVTIIGESPEEMKELYDKLAAEFHVIRTKNTYLETVTEFYRDIKVWLAVDTENGLMNVECQLILKYAYEQKKWMHMAYEYFRGSADWNYTRIGPSIDDVFREGWRLYHGILGTRSELDMSKAEEKMIEVAEKGHFVARGMCHTEGWGKYQKDPKAATGCFAAAAGGTDGQAGRREAKCRLAVHYLAAVKDVEAHRVRGLDLLQESADEQEPEAVFRLFEIEEDRKEKEKLLKEAFDLGHRRAVDKMQFERKQLRKVSLRL